jgi:purine-binding chemotaxis protein CheW
MKDNAREMLVFKLGSEEYGVDILKVQEIRGYEKVTPIPRSPDYLKGVVNLRGTIVPVIDLRIRFGMPDPKYDSLTVVIVLRIAGRIVGAVVDAVSDVVRLAENEIREAPKLGAMVDGSYLSGVATQGERMILALDIEKLLSAAEMNLLGEAAAAAPSS